MPQLPPPCHKKAPENTLEHCDCWKIQRVTILLVVLIYGGCWLQLVALIVVVVFSSSSNGSSSGSSTGSSSSNGSSSGASNSGSR